MRRPSTCAWTTMLVVGLLGVLVAGLSVGAVGHRLGSIVGDDAWTLALVAWVPGVAALVLVLLARPIGGQGAHAAFVGSTVVAVVVALQLAWRAIAGTNDERGFDAEQALSATVGLAIALALLVVIAIRCHRAWRATVPRRAVARRRRRRR